MAVSTHRWRPEMGVKSGYTRSRKYKRVHYLKDKKNCIIECKFEKSLYFLGVKNPIIDVYNLSKTSTASLSRIYSNNKFSETLISPILDHRITKKLYISEYVDGTNVHALAKLTDPFVRGYIINDDKYFLEDAISMLEICKGKFSQDDWNSFRIILTSKSCDISTDILRRDRIIQKVSNLKFPALEKVEDLMEFKRKDIDEFDEDNDETLTDDTRSTNTTMDEDAEEKQRNKIAASKFRDSRIILANRPKPIKPEVDPVEKCFLALTKLFEDSIFSAAKGLKELNMELMSLSKISNDSLEKFSNDSFDVNLQMK